MAELTPLQKAFLLITKLKKLVDAQQNKRIEPIAIVGVSGRFPGADNKNEFWQLLTNNKNVITQLPEERWNQLSGTEETFLRKMNHPYWGSYLKNIDLFDAYFFGISPREATLLDPQQRILLEVMYEAFEDAGTPLEELSNSNTGVFASIYASQFGRMVEFKDNLDALYVPTGNAISMVANRLSYLFNLNGPSLVFDTACSSSLVALHIACLNLQNNFCDVAVVGAANINLLPSTNYLLTQAKMLSPDGQCKTFDSHANGYVQGEGACALILKPLSLALKNKDRIYCIITSTAVNQDGKSNGLTAPNGLQQEALLRQAYETAKINPEEVSYVECHGTGTFLGDPIEAEALGHVLGKTRSSDKPCLIGSVKTNIGHLEPAAGVTGVAKVALALKNNLIPAHLNFTTPNPNIDFKKYKVKVCTENEVWPDQTKKIAGVSSFGFGGTNAHIVLSASNESVETTPVTREMELFTLSAKNLEALQAVIKTWYHYLIENPSINLGQLCYCLHTKRAHHSYRLAILVKNREELKVLLGTLIQDPKFKSENVFITKNEVQAPLKKLEVNKDIELKKLAEHYIQNETIDWLKWEEDRSFENIDMPTYPWQHKSYWPKFKMMGSKTLHQNPLEPSVLSSPVAENNYEFIFDSKTLPELKDTYQVVHIGFYLEMLASICKKLGYKPEFEINELQFLHVLMVPPGSEVKIQVLLNKKEESKWQFSFYSRSNQRWIENATGSFQIKAFALEKLNVLEQINQTSPEEAETLYKRIFEMGMPAGDSIRWTKKYWINKNEIICQLEKPKVCQSDKEFALNVHPGLFDASVQPLFALLPQHIENPFMASSVSQIKIQPITPTELYLHIKLNTLAEDNSLSCDATLFDNEQNSLVEFKQILLLPLDKKIQMAQILKEDSQVAKELSSLPTEKKFKYVVDFLKEQISTIFSIPQEDINSKQPLREIGLDSIMGLALLQVLDNHFQFNYSLDLLLEGPSIEDLAHSILKITPQTQPKFQSFSRPLPKTPWIAFREPRPEAQFRLFCFPYGGGSASIYRDWHKGLPPSIEVCPIQYPGREQRLNERPLSDLNQMLDKLVKELSSYFDLPFAFFGHSMGGLIAYELACRLRELNRPIPKQLFISAFPDPSIPTKSLNRLLGQLEKHHIRIDNIDNSKSIERLTDHQLIVLSRAFADNGLTDYKEYLLNKEISKILLPIFVNDMKMIRGYDYKPRTPLDCPITVFLSKNDPWIPYKDHLSWKNYTTTRFDVVEYNHGHLFIKDKQVKKNILLKIEESIKKSNMNA